jgi:hypothetical protein
MLRLNKKFASFAFFAAKYPLPFPPRVETVSQRQTSTNVILSVSEESRLSRPYEKQILRLSPQDDIATQSRRGEG